ncbi:MAG TPA: hypothetical protein VGS41_14360 [Chthonomonadales bacterium]|nr:hypothetical protein [Chthonomonadales bacterium]
MSTVLICLAAPALLNPKARATPAYALREQKACIYCHVSASPGYVDPTSGKAQTAAVNAAGLYYQTHNHSFTGYRPAPPPASTEPAPRFDFVWKEDLGEPVRRIAVAPVLGDGIPRLITLAEQPGKPQESMLNVWKWTGATLATVASGSVQASADRIAVGQFAGPQAPPVIVTPDALWYWSGKALTRAPAASPLQVLGGTTLLTGEERVLIQIGPTDVRAYRIAKGAAHWLVDGIPAPSSTQVSFGDMHASPQQFNQMGMPVILREGGMVGLWNADKQGCLYLYYIKPDQDFDVKPDPAHPSKPLIKLKSRSSFVVLRDPRVADGAELWSTPRIPGIVYDVALSDPRSGRPGLLVLAAPVGPDSPSILYFFALR